MTEVVVLGLDINSGSSVAPVGKNPESQARAVESFSVLGEQFNCEECPAGQAVTAMGVFSGPMINIDKMLKLNAVYLQCKAKGSTRLHENCHDARVLIEY
ncbi:hypothetical protein KBD75_01910 [Candidatus Woesebacteria bacterium]|nr:hypothetical protein [Candidatus Woesebacteria bacterium]